MSTREFCPIAIIGESDSTDHFAGVRESLQARGVDASQLRLDDVMGRIIPPKTRVVAVADTQSFRVLSVLRQARRAGACTVLLMDGITEYRNTFENPNVRPEFLRPEPVDIIACAGDVDRHRLEELGNVAIATGLPRLDALGAMPRPDQPRIMVATAKHPTFNETQREQLIRALILLRDRLTALGVDVIWRLTDGLAEVLDVHQDTAPLHESLARASAVLTTPSTLLVEAMLADRPTGLLFPFDAPCWPQAAWMLDAESPQNPGIIDQTIQNLLHPDQDALSQQSQILKRMHQSKQPACDAVADLLIDMADNPRQRDVDLSLLDPTRLPARVAPTPGRTRVLSLVRCDLSPVGGVTTWSERLGRAFAADSQLGYDFRTLIIATHPGSASYIEDGKDDLRHLVIVDPAADHWKAIQTVKEAIERLNPDIILPNYADMCYAAAMLTRRQGKRLIAVAHTDHQSYSDLIGFYDRWDGAVGVSAACIDWLDTIANGRPLHKIVYGVPVASSPRTVETAGPLKITYIGRMVEVQKRISDLLLVIDGLESRAVKYEFHTVGDGDDVDAWQTALAKRTLEHGRVIQHGRKPEKWVEHFLATVDVSVLVSDYEGTSITMLESMGAGVVPVVTRVSSGVDEWVHDGVNGIVVEVGQTDQMAQRLADLASDRARLGTMGLAAWETVKDRISIDVMARNYKALFDEVIKRPIDQSPTDLGLRLIENYTWCKEWAEDPDGAMEWIRSSLGESGYRNIAIDIPGEDSDAVIFRATAGQPVDERVKEYRASGLGVAVWPYLHDNAVTDRLHRCVDEAVAAGHKRIVMYGLGKHTQKASGLFDRELPIVGLIDDNPPRSGCAYDLPVVTLEHVIEELKPDAILLSSDAWEEQMWHKTAALREAGIDVIAVYGTYE